ncbi:S-adenosylmethionine:tRNA ribosyltransferase-isomerase [Lapillicoccus sp.]|uniref:S-adenosylmethionine:tRNA ribosyltransferase-isomerase n=1 Tax=Lapillicoccus sp. TaxID=1909287 RepID=UPI003983A3BC
MTRLDERPTTRFPVSAAATAPAPAEHRGGERDLVRLLVAQPEAVTHARFRDLADHLAPGDLLVVNDSATIAAEIDAVLAGRGPVVLHVASGPAPHGPVVELRTAPDAARPVLDAAPGDVVRTGGARLVLLGPYADGSGEQATRLWRAEVDGDLAAHLHEHGRPVAYGQLDRRYALPDYQTVFARRPGSAEMPSAGRPFTPELVTRLVLRGVAVAPITLHTGLSSQEVGEAPAPEWFSVPAPTARLVGATRSGGGRVVAVGTTVTRALESAVDPDGRVVAAQGWTHRVVTPAEPPRVVDGLVTGWHDPQASHLLLVEAVAGAALAQRAYDAATAAGYLWHEFGDSVLLLPHHGGGRQR